MSRNTLFERKTFKMHSGNTGFFKIECDSLTDEDIETLAFIIHNTMKEGDFSLKKVYGVPRGGVRLQKALEKYLKPNAFVGGVELIVDDVFTTGRSMEEARTQKINEGWNDPRGIVIFARSECPGWIRPIFDMGIFGDG